MQRNKNNNNFFSETMQAKRWWSDIVKVPKEKLGILNENIFQKQRISFLNILKLKEFTTSSPVLFKKKKKMLKEVRQRETGIKWKFGSTQSNRKYCNWQHMGKYDFFLILNRFKR